jgi:DNA polymerase-4
VAALAEATLVSIVGPGAGRHLHALAHNQDPRPVTVGRRRRSIGSQHALGSRRHSDADIDAVLVGLVDRVTRRLRGAHRVGRTIMLRLRFGDFTRATRSHTLEQATAHTPTILAAVRTLLAEAEPAFTAGGLTLVGVTVANLSDDEAVQLPLPFSRRSTAALDTVLDELADRYGTGTVTRAVLLGRDQGVTVPLLPD